MKKPTTKAKRKPTVSKAVKKYVKKQTKKLGEVKYMAATQVSYSATYASGIACTPLYDNVEGVGTNQRIGKIIQPTSAQIRFSAYRGNTDCHLRLVAFRYRDNVATINNNFVLDNIGSALTVNYINNPLTINKAYKLHEVLYDKTWILDDGLQNGLHKVVNLKTASRTVKYTSNTAGQNRKDEIYYFFMSDVPSGNEPLINIVTVSKYRDV